MVDQSLVNYINQQRQAGYTDDQIKQAMLQYGYDAQTVQEALNPKKAGFKIPTVAIILVALVIIIGVFYLVFSGDEPVSFTISTNPVVSEIDPGKSLSFNVNINGISERVSLTHDIETSSGNLIDTETDSASGSSLSTITAPTSPGTYTVTTTATYDDQSKTSTFSFTVKEEQVIPDEPIIEDQCPTTCDDQDPCTRDDCGADTNYRCAHFKISPCCGNSICETDETYDSCSQDCVADEDVITPSTGLTIQEITEEAKSKANSPDATSYCNGLAKEYHRDSCFNTVAEESQTSSFCENIASDTTRDNCYTNFALTGDYTVCEKLVNKYLKASCISLSEAS